MNYHFDEDNSKYLEFVDGTYGDILGSYLAFKERHILLQNIDVNVTFSYEDATDLMKAKVNEDNFCYLDNGSIDIDFIGGGMTIEAYGDVSMDFDEKVTNKIFEVLEDQLKENKING